MSLQDKSSETYCPVCDKDNQCAMAVGKPVAECWCVSVNITAEALDAIPEAAVGKVCLCQDCATKTGEKSGGR